MGRIEQEIRKGNRPVIENKRSKCLWLVITTGWMDDIEQKVYTLKEEVKLKRAGKGTYKYIWMEDVDRLYTLVNPNYTFQKRTNNED